MVTPGPSSQAAQAADAEVEDAETVCDDLEDALGSLGLTLPSLGVDLGPGGERLPASPPLIELGRCNVETARALVAALHSGVTKEAAR
jgi:hypothetical protein